MGVKGPAGWSRWTLMVTGACVGAGAGAPSAFCPNDRPTKAPANRAHWIARRHKSNARRPTRRRTRNGEIMSSRAYIEGLTLRLDVGVRGFPPWRQQQRRREGGATLFVLSW